MTFLTENPSNLIWLCLGAAVVCLVALRITQRMKFLLFAAVAGGLALLLILIDRLIVTDNERIEEALQQMVVAARDSNGREFIRWLTPDASIRQGDVEVAGKAVAHDVIIATLDATHFDFLNATQVQIQSDPQTHTGTAEFRLSAAGRVQSQNFATGTEGSNWRLHFREVDGAWKAHRIDAVHLPYGASLPILHPGSK